MLINTIKSNIQHAIDEVYGLQLESKDINVDHPIVEEFGDYTSNIAMKLVKLLSPERKSNPIDIAESLAKYLKASDSKELFEKVLIVPPGFINITIRISDMDKIKKENFQLPETHKTVLIEHTGPNTNKPLHIGHVRNATLGSSMAAIAVAAGQKVLAANINNDRGIHIIKSMYGYLKYGRNYNNNITFEYKAALAEWSKDRSKWATPIDKNLKPDHFVGYYYIQGNNDYEESEAQVKVTGLERPEAPHIQMQNMLVNWEENETSIRELWKQNNSWYYEGMHQTLKALNIKSPNDQSKFFDKEWYESEIYKSGKDLVINKIGNGVITEFEDGHVEAVLERYNLPNIVLLRKNKTSLYITQDIELLKQRIQDLGQDIVVYLTGNEQNLRFQQLFATAEALGIGKRSQMVHIGYGAVRLPDGKMSSRKGNVITADGLLEEVTAHAWQKINQERSEYSDIEKEEISRQVAVAAIKYGILKYNPMSNIIFDIQSNISFEGDTGPYIQYTYARARSISRKYMDKFNKADRTAQLAEMNTDEHLLARKLFKFVSPHISIKIEVKMT